MGLDKLVIQAGLFNQKSTEIERKLQLENIIKTKQLTDDIDSEIPDDFAINKMLARNQVQNNELRFNNYYIAKKK